MREKAPPKDDNPLGEQSTAIGLPAGHRPIASTQSGVLDQLVGEVLAGRYRIDHLLGVGGMGTVYAAHHLGLDKRVAIKVIQPRFAADPIIAQRFSQEAHAVSILEHENIVQVLDFGVAPGGSPYLVMEFLNGEDLETTIRREGPLPWRRVVHIAEQIARVLAAAHAQGIVHRDIKPANCYRTPRYDAPDFIKVLDFGLAKIRARGRPDDPMTRPGGLLGTPGYIAPEVYRGGDADHRVDIFALGVLMHKLLTGSLPPAVHAADTTSLRDVPAPLAMISALARTLSEDPKDRYPNAQALARALASLKMYRSEEPTPRPELPLVKAGPAAKRTMTYALCRDIMVLAHGSQTPTDAEWDNYVAQIGARSTGIRGFLVFTDGGGPTSSQRRALKQMAGRSGLLEVKMAVVSTDRLTRGIVIALALVAPNMRAFKPDAIDDALTHIQITGPARQAIIAEVEWLRRQIAP